MADLLLNCMIDINTEWNPTPGVQRRTTFKYREGQVSFDITKYLVQTIRCPCCNKLVEFTVYPGLKFKDALKLSWKLNHKWILGFLIIGIILGIFCLPLGLLLLLGSFWSLLFEDMYGLNNNLQLKIIDSTDMKHQLFFGKKNITKSRVFTEDLQERDVYYDKYKTNLLEKKEEKIALIICKHCGKEINKTARNCPHCGAYHWTNIRMGCAIIFAAFFVILILMVIMTLTGK